MKTFDIFFGNEIDILQLEKNDIKAKYTKLFRELDDVRSYYEALDFVPVSVWRNNKFVGYNDLKEIFPIKYKKWENLSDKYPDSVGARGGYQTKAKDSMSSFNPIIAFNILKIWSKEGDWVIDPFAGRDRPFITNFMNRNYTGYEITTSTYKELITTKKNWRWLDHRYEMNIIKGDGTKLEKEKDGVYDFCYTCPPYWFCERYESCEGQLSDIPKKRIDLWLQAVYDTGKNIKRVMKSGKNVVIIVADIRNEGVLIPLHTHFINEFDKAGLVLKDIVINETWGCGIVGVNLRLKEGKMVKGHEYFLVFST